MTPSETPTTPDPAPWRAKLALLACIVGMMTALVPFFLGTFPLFLEPVSATMGWDRATFPAMIMAIALLGALTGPLIGRAIDRFGARPVGILGAGLWGVGLLLLSQIGPSFLFRIPIILCLGLGGGLAGQIVYAHVLSRWFTRNRGIMLGIALGTAPAVSQAIAAPVVSMLIGSVGWRSGYIALGGFVVCVTFVINILFLREPPRTAAVSSEAAAAPVVEGDSSRAAITSLRFWVMTLVVTLGTGAYMGIFQHSVAILGTKGLPASIGPAFVSVAALASIPSPLVAGLLLDRVKSPKLAVFPFQLLTLLGAVLLTNVDGTVPVLVAAALLGISIASAPAIQPFVLTRYFGVKAQSEILGLSLIGVIVGATGGPVLMGAIYDSTGSYATGLIVFQLVALAASLLSLLLPRYRYAAGAGGPGHGAP